MTVAPLVTMPAVAVTIAGDGGLVVRPAGWIGTTDQWTQGLGIALVLLNLIVLLVAWRQLGRQEGLQAVMGTLFMGLMVLPVLVIFFGYSKGMAGMEAVEACGGCHVMEAHVRDLINPGSEALAAVHYKNRYIRENHCYTCHSDYGMLGTVSAKMDGMRHVRHYLAGSYTLPLKIARPYSNVRCLACHGQSQKFVKSPGHPPEVRLQLISDEASCVTCHGPVHTPMEAKR